MQTHVIPTTWSSHGTELSRLRTKVFVEEQGVPQEEEWDLEDEHCVHFLAVNEVGHYLGCARLLDSGQIGRMAVLQEHRGHGIGAQLLEAAVQEGIARGMERLFLHAQTYAEPFYQRGGFVRCGGEYLEVGIPHVPMEMKLPIAFDGSPTDSPVRTATHQAERAGSSDSRDSAVSIPVTFDTIVAAREGLIEVAQAARRHVRILSPYLDHALFNDQAFIDVLSAFARSAPRCQVQMMIMSSKLIVQRGHDLVELARRLDEKIELRLLEEQINPETSSLTVFDHQGYWLLPSYEVYAGVYDLNNPVATRRLTETFDQAWARSKPDPELRLLRM